MQERIERLDQVERDLSVAREHGARVEDELAAARERIRELDMAVEEVTWQREAAHAEADEYAAEAEQAEEELAVAVRDWARLAACSDATQTPHARDNHEPVPADFGALIDAAQGWFTLMNFDALATDADKTTQKCL